MKIKTLLLRLALTMTLVAGLGASQLRAQQLIWGSSPFQDSLWSVDTTSWSIVNRFGPTLAGFTITGMTGMAYDPCQHETYIIMKVSGVSGRVLGKIDLSTGVCTQVGNLGDNFSSINFREDGQLFGVTGDGATVPETLYLIDKATGATTVAAALGAGADGEVICYNRDDNFFYHWSGNGTIVYERVMSVAPYTATNIPIVGTTSGETFGTLYIGGGNFLVSNISSSFNHCNTAGNWTASFGSNPDDLRGLVMPPVFQFSGSDVCEGDTVFADWTYSGYTTDTVIYVWGDGTSDTLTSPGGMSHDYTAVGAYTSYVILSNFCNAADTMASATVNVFPSPVVTITPDPAFLCDAGDTIMLTGLGDVSMQWYMDGVMIPGETDTTYIAGAAGIYNMIATNSDGCSDSAAVGLTVMVAPATIDFLAPLDSSHICEGDSIGLKVSAGATTYDWLLDGSPVASGSASTLDVGVGGDYTVIAYFGLCAVTTTSDLTIIEDPLPVASFSYVDNGDSTVTFTDGSTDATSWAWDFGDGGTSTLPNPTHDYGTDGVFVVTLIVSNSCGSDTLVDSTQVMVGIRDAVSHGFSMSNQPNPFSESTTFVVNAAHSENATLVIYNVNGQVVRTLLAGQLVSGTTRFVWDGRSDRGSSIASGAYQAVLRTESGQVSRQVILTK